MINFYNVPVFVSHFTAGNSSGRCTDAELADQINCFELYCFFFMISTLAQPQLNHNCYENSYYSPGRKPGTCRSWLA